MNRFDSANFCKGLRCLLSLREKITKKQVTDTLSYLFYIWNVLLSDYPFNEIELNAID